MTRALLRIELARYGALSLLGLLLALVPLSVLPNDVLLDNPYLFPLMLVVAAWSVPLACLFEEPRTRRFEQALPISRVALYLMRMGVLGAVMLATLAPPLAVVAVWAARSGHALAPLAAKSADLIGASALLAVFCLAWPERSEAPDTLDRSVIWGFAALLGIAVVVIPGPLVGIASLVAAGFTLRHFVRTTAATPSEPALRRLAARRPGPATTAGAGAAAEAGDLALRWLHRLPPLHRLLVRRIMERSAALGACLLLALLMLAISDSQSSTSTLFTFYLFHFYFLHVLSVFRELDALPVARRWLAAYLLAPSCAALVALTCSQGALWGPRPTQIRIVQHSDKTLFVATPDSAWRRQLAPEPPSVTAPWGETVQLEMRHPLAGNALSLWEGLALYNPYSVAPTSSLGLLAWQLARAGKDLHGADVPPETILRYLFERDRSKAWSPDAPFARNVSFLDLDYDVSFDELFGPPPDTERARELAWLIAVWALSLSLLLGSASPPPARTLDGPRVLGAVPALAMMAYGLTLLASFALVNREEDPGSLLISFLTAPFHPDLGSSAAWYLLDAALIALVCAWVVWRTRRSELDSAASPWTRRR